MSDPTLAQRAVACPGWRWLAGMRTACGLRVYSVGDPFPMGIREGDRRARPECRGLPHNAVPDVIDALTLGAMLALWEARRDSMDDATWLLHDTRVRMAMSGAGFRSSATAAAIVAALEAP